MSKFLLIATLMMLTYHRTIGQYPGHELLFFRSNPEGSKGQLYRMATAGTDPKPLGQSGSRPDYDADLSPDGNWITFQSYRKGGWRIWIMHKDGGQARRLISSGYGPQSYEFDPAFDQTGRYVLFFRYADGGTDLFKVAVGTGEVSALTNTSGISEFCPDVSTAGEIAFTYATRGENGIGLIDSGGRRSILSKSAKSQYHAPIWSPDGSQILFYSDKDGGFELFIMNRDGSEVRRLISEELLRKEGILAGKVLPFDEGWNACLQYTASFSIDGSFVAFSADTRDGREIFLYDRKTKSIDRITQNKVHDGFPVIAH